MLRSNQTLNTLTYAGTSPGQTVSIPTTESYPIIQPLRQRVETLISDYQHRVSEGTQTIREHIGTIVQGGSTLARIIRDYISETPTEASPVEQTLYFAKGKKRRKNKGGESKQERKRRQYSEKSKKGRPSNYTTSDSSDQFNDPNMTDEQVRKALGITDTDELDVVEETRDFPRNHPGFYGNRGMPAPTWVLEEAAMKKAKRLRAELGKKPYESLTYTDGQGAGRIDYDDIPADELQTRYEEARDRYTQAMEEGADRDSLDRLMRDVSGLFRRLEEIERKNV